MVGKISNDGVKYLERLEASGVLGRINRGRKSDDWKVKIFRHEPTGLELAIWAQKRILVLLEQEIRGVGGCTLQSERPKNSALKVQSSRFSTIAGACYEVEGVSALAVLISAYLALPSPDVSIFTAEFEQSVQRALTDSTAARRARISRAPSKPRKVVATTTVFIRNGDVAAEVLARASGYCEDCGSEAPFKKRSTGLPYLEVHHRVPLAQGGDDTVANAVALCPNCHRHQHYG